MPRATDAALLAGRVILGGYFIYSGAIHFVNTPQVAALAASSGVPSPTLATLATGFLLLAGGVSLVLGLLPRAGLALLIVFFVGVTPMVHAFWTIADPALRQAQFAAFVTNLAILGALLAMMAIPTPWYASVDDWWEARHVEAGRPAA